MFENLKRNFCLPDNKIILIILKILLIKILSRIIILKIIIFWYSIDYETRFDTKPSHCFSINIKYNKPKNTDFYNKRVFGLLYPQRRNNKRKSCSNTMFRQHDLRHFVTTQFFLCFHCNANATNILFQSYFPA